MVKLTGIDNIGNSRQMRSVHLLFFIVILSLGIKVNLSRDQYLHEWDERYHALVAKNLATNPGYPTLYAQQVHQLDHKNWILNNVWLSKPPIPLWCMALSIKVFGANEWAVRMPALLFSCIIVLITYLMGKELHSKKMGLCMAALMGIHGMLSDLVSGRLSSDSVETCFLMFVFLSIYLVVNESNKFIATYRYALVGLCTGLAILCKWQPALLVIIVLFIYRMRRERIGSHIMKTSGSLLLALTISSLWIVYCLKVFPIEMSWMLQAMFTPFVDASLNPDGQWHSYLKDFGNLFGYTTFVLIAVYAWRVFTKREMKQLALLIWMVLPLVIFSMAEVKRGTYLFISAPAIFYCMGWALLKLAQLTHKWQVAAQVLSLVSILFVVGYSVDKLYLFRERSITRDWCEQIKHTQWKEDTVLYNEPRYIEMMFYHKVTAYPFSREEIASGQP